MDNSQRRASGIPRLSRLPRPVSIVQPAQAPAPASAASSTPSLRPRPSRDSLAGDVQNPKLRASTSRGQLRPSANTSERKPALRNSSSNTQLRSNSTRTPASKPAAPVSKPLRNVSESRRWSTTTNAPASQFKSWAEPSESSKLDFEREQDSTEASNDLLTAYLNDSASLSHQIDDGESPALSPRALSPRALSPRAFSPQALSPRALSPLSPATSPMRDTPHINAPKPSLSDRTIETLSHLPSSPALRKGSSSFFDSNRPMSRAESSASRPGSSYTSGGSAGHSSRPGSSGGPDDSAFSNPRKSSVNLFKRPLSVIHGAPDRTPGAASNSAQRLRPASRVSGVASKPSASMPEFRSPSPDKLGKTPTKTVQKPASKPLKPKASARGLAKKAALDAGENPGSGISSWDGTIAPPAPTAKEAAVESNQGAQKSSTALRDQIAKAKAARRAAVKQTQDQDQAPGAVSTPNDVAAISSNSGFNYDAAFEDPFNLNKGQDAGDKVLKQRIGAARTSGKLNIAAMGLKEIPSDVMKMYDMESIGAGGSWAESVELTRLIAADNELETLDDAMFPDLSLEELENDEEGRGNMFGGLETVDLHGNKLLAIPMGFRRFTQLTTLNLSSNRLENGCLEIIAQMTAVRDLKLANNHLTGSLGSCLTGLSALEIFDVHGNKLSALPSNIEDLSRLRVLNLSENSFKSLPFEGLSKLPLTELDLKKNQLSGTLIGESIGALPTLQTLDISVNRLTRLVPADTSINLPVVHTLTLSMNRLQELPDMATWTSLLTLAADTNNISSIPLSFTSLEKIRQADFSSNDIRVVPPEISRMDSLTLLRLSGNPLRDKKFASASTDEIKEALSTRLEPPPPYQEPAAQEPIVSMISQLDIEKKQGNMATINADDADSRSEGDDDFATPPTSAPHSPARSRAQTLVRETWPVKTGGLLDRSHTETSSLSPEMCAELSRSYQIRQAQLHHNLLSAFPGSLQFFSQTLTSLTLSHNKIAGEAYLTEDLSLPALTELNMSSNTITSLGPLTKFLKAPALEKIDVSLNRLSTLPLDLKQSFPNLKVLVASNNQLTELDPAAVKGLKVVDVSSNDIGHLDPRLGLLGGKDGLERLEVAGNRFKVPKWNILEKGTAATMKWLRGRVPAEEMEEWRAENGEDDSDVD
ncbi:L domain-like protein [Trichoderma austrokoningii]